MKKSKITREEAEIAVEKFLDLFLGVSVTSQNLIKIYLEDKWSSAHPNWRKPSLSDDELIKTLIKQGMWNNPCFLNHMEKSSLIWDAMSNWCSFLLLKNNNLSPELTKFYVFAQQFPEKRSSRSGPDPLVKQYRNHVLLTALYLLESLGYYPITINDAGYDKGRNDSGVYIVHSIYCKLLQISLGHVWIKYRLGHDRIKRLWMKNPKLYRRLMDLQISLYPIISDPNAQIHIPHNIFCSILSPLFNCGIANLDIPALYDKN